MKQLGFQPELEVWTVWTRSGRSGHGLRCLEPGQKFRKFNSDHFPFFKNLYRTFGSRVSLPWLEIGSGRSGNGVRCLEPGQKFRIFNSDHFTFLKNFNPTSGSRVSIFGQKNTSFSYCKKIPGHTSTSGIRIQLHCVQSSPNTFSAKHCADCAMCNV